MQLFINYFPFDFYITDTLLSAVVEKKGQIRVNLREKGSHFAA